VKTRLGIEEMLDLPAFWLFKVFVECLLVVEDGPVWIPLIAVDLVIAGVSYRSRQRERTNPTRSRVTT
jgi:hypothetical protein